MVPVQDSYMQNRAEALQNVESTIVELSNIFSQLATMVAQQGEIAIRYIIIILLVLLKVKWPLFINIFQHLLHFKWLLFNSFSFIYLFQCKIE